MIIELSNGTVELKNNLTWWDVQELKAIREAGMRLSSDDMKKVQLTIDANTSMQMTVKTFEKIVIKITEGEKSFSFSENWLRSLNIEDGDKLFEAVNEITKPKKK